MLGFEMKINNRTMAWRDYSKIVSKEGTTANVHLPEHFLPLAFDDELLGFDYSYFNVKGHGCEYNAKEIVEEWIALEGHGLPLSKATQAMVVAEVFHFVRGFMPVVSPWISLVELVDLIKFCWKIKDFEYKFNRLKRNLSGILKHLDLKNRDPSNYLDRVDKLFTAVASWVSEFTIVRTLSRLGHNIKLPPRGYDIEIEGFKAGRVEVKSRMEPLIGELVARYEKGLKDEPSEPVRIVPETIVMMICHTALHSIERAIQKQNAQIVFVDISRSFGGLLMLTSSLLKMELPFDKAVSEAIDLAKTGKTVVVVYVQYASSTHNILGWTFEKEKLESIGKIVAKIKLNLTKTGKRINEMDLARFLDVMFIKT
jgi:hypothetical protein